MKELRIETNTDRVLILMNRIAYNETMLAEYMKVSLDTISLRMKFDDWRVSELNSLRRLAKSKGYIFKYIPVTFDVPEEFRGKSILIHRFETPR